MNENERRVIFKPGVKYVLRHYYTIAGVAGVFGLGMTYGGYRVISWNFHKEEGANQKE